MSHWPRDGENSDATAESLRSKQNDLDRMIEQGRSFSGRERNCVFLNTGQQQFANVSAISGLDFDNDGRAVAAVDWDQDGDLDLWTSNRNAPRLRLLRNESTGGHNFLAVKLQGDGTSVSRDAIGTRVELVSAELEERRLIRTLRAGEGYLAQSSKWVHFGLGDIEDIEKVVVRWPHGEVEEFTDLKVNQRYLLVQHAGQGEPVPPPTRELALVASVLKPPTPPGRVRVPLMLRLPLPEASYLGFDGTKHPLTYGSGRPQLICLWSEDCTNCKAELTEFANREHEIRAAGVDLVALSFDALGGDASGPAKAAAFINARGFPFSSGLAERDFVQLMQGYHNMQVFLAKPLPVPASFLIDAEGRLKAIYKGQLSVEQLLQDVRDSPTSLTERIEWSACLPGRTIPHDSVLQVSQRLENKAYFGMAQAFAGQELFGTSAKFYRRVLDAVPDFAEGHQRLAVVLEQLGQSDTAMVHYRQAIQLEPEHAFAHYNLSNLLNNKRRFQEAIKGYQRAITINPDFWKAHVNLGGAFFELQDYEQAAQHYRRAIEINPDFVQAKVNLQRVESMLQSKSD